MIKQIIHWFKTKKIRKVTHPWWHHKGTPLTKEQTRKMMLKMWKDSKR